MLHIAQANRAHSPSKRQYTLRNDGRAVLEGDTYLLEEWLEDALELGRVDNVENLFDLAKKHYLLLRA